MEKESRDLVASTGHLCTQTSLFVLCVFNDAAKCTLDVNYSKVRHESVIKIIKTNLIRSFFSARRNNEHRRKPHTMLKPFSDISFTLHSDEEPENTDPRSID